MIGRIGIVLGTSEKWVFGFKCPFLHHGVCLYKQIARKPVVTDKERAFSAPIARRLMISPWS